MPFNAKSFRDNLKFGGARPNNFEVIISGSGTQFFNSTRPVMFMANATQMPGSVIGTIPLPYFGRPINLSGDRVFEDWTCALYTDEDMVTRNAFEKWNAMMSYTNFDTNSEHGTIAETVNSYVSTVEIKHYTKTGKVDKVYKLVNAFPYIVSPVELAWQLNDQVMQFQVQWKYDYFLTTYSAFPTEGRYDLNPDNVKVDSARNS